MAIGDPYITLPELKSYMQGMKLSQDTFDDLLNFAIASSSEEIEQHCNRQFNKQTSATARVFEILTKDFVYVADFYTALNLVVELAWPDSANYEVVAPENFELFPLDGVVNDQPGWPFWKIVPRRLFFPCGGRLRVTAQWGWNEVPAPVKQAALIMAAETYKLKDAPFGVAGFDSFGSIRVRDNAMAASKLRRYVRDPILVG